LRKIPAIYLKEVFEEFKAEYGPTFPLYGSNTVRHDISGSVRPLLSSTEIPHIKVLVERSGISKKTIEKILKDPEFEVLFDMADQLLTAMDMEWKWFDPPLDIYYYSD